MLTPQIEEPQVHLWTRDEMVRMEDAGLFEGKRVELLEVRIFEMPPMKTPHDTALLATEEQLRAWLPSSKSDAACARLIRRAVSRSGGGIGNFS